MSKRADRKNRKREKIRESIRNSVIAAVIGIVFLALGIVGIVGNGRKYSAYRDSPDRQTVEAEITYAEPKTRKDETGKAYEVCDVKLQYTADGREYNGKTRLYHRAQKGDTEEIEVYRTAQGEYRIPVITTREELLLHDVIPLISVVVGALLAVIGGVMIVSDTRELRRL
ncbi:MAG: DUF3592 domain-containing protein [Clostridia bacterium]|nr:DUF3592 domain-containing protein [Clostridia bacterium]